MSLTSTALLLLSVQRHDLEDQPGERETARQGLRLVEAARAAGHLVVLVQWDGDSTEHPTFSRGWTLYPDFRAEAGELLVRASLPDAFSSSDLDAQLKARAVRHLTLAAVPTAQAAVSATAASARQLGYTVTVESLNTEAEGVRA